MFFYRLITCFESRTYARQAHYTRTYILHAVIQSKRYSYKPNDSPLTVSLLCQFACFFLFHFSLCSYRILRCFFRLYFIYPFFVNNKHLLASHVKNTRIRPKNGICYKKILVGRYCRGCGCCCLLFYKFFSSFIYSSLFYRYFLIKKRSEVNVHLYLLCDRLHAIVYCAVVVVVVDDVFLFF